MSTIVLAQFIVQSLEDLKNAKLNYSRKEQHSTSLGNNVNIINIAVSKDIFN